MLQGRDAVEDNSPTICIRALSVYGEAGPLAQGLEYPLKPSSHDPGGHHIISTRLIALLSHRDVRSIQEWAKTGEHFIKLEWTFPSCSYPKFTTRHALDQGETPAPVSFSGGLGWATRMLKTAENFNFTNPPEQGRSDSGIWDPASVYGSPKLPLQPSPFTTWINWSAIPGFLTDPIQIPYFHGQGKEDSSDCLDHISEETFSDTDTGSSLTFSDLGDATCMESYNPTEFASFGDESAGRLPSLQLQSELLRRQRINAEVMYARNGDTSGMLAVLASASQVSDYWDSAGMPRF